MRMSSKTHHDKTTNMKGCLRRHGLCVRPVEHEGLPGGAAHRAQNQGRGQQEVQEIGDRPRRGVSTTPFIKKNEVRRHKGRRLGQEGLRERVQG